MKNSEGFKRFSFLSFAVLFSSIYAMAATSFEYVDYIKKSDSKCVWVDKIGGAETDSVRTLPITGC